MTLEYRAPKYRAEFYDILDKQARIGDKIQKSLKFDDQGFQMWKLH